MNTRALALALLLPACGQRQPAQPPPLAGARIGGPFALTDQHGRRVTDRDFAGRYRVMYFGYTYCPDVCPADMGRIAAAMRLLDAEAPALARRVVPVFVSVDPARDTPAVLAQFARAFDPRVVALTGTPAEVEAVAREYGVWFAKGAPTPGGGYLVQHSAQTYLIDPAGRPLALLPADTSARAVADEIRRWAT